MLANDTDADGDPLTIAAVTQGARGEVAIEAGRIRYTPATGTKADTFTYTASDGHGGSATGTVTVNFLTAPPVARADSATVVDRAWTPVEVLANDDDGNGGTSVPMIVAATHGAKGEVEIKAGTPWTVRYQPYSTFTGSDTFTYTIRHLGGQTATATVTVTAAGTGTNRPPVANADSATTMPGVAKTIAVLANDTDPDGDALVVTGATQPAVGGGVTPGANSVTFTPSAGFSGTATFSYTVSDGRGGTATGSVSVSVTASANRPPVANTDSATATIGVAKTIAVLANDTDPDGDALTITAVGTPQRGTVSNQGASLLYTGSAIGTDTFNYTVSDGRGGTATGTVTLSNSDSGGNRPPVAVADALSFPAGSIKVRMYVLANDSDPDGDVLSLSAVTAPAVGQGTCGITTDISGVQHLLFRPPAGFIGPATFTYTITDGRGGTATGDVSVGVTSTANRAPVANADSAATTAGLAKAITVLGNDTDPDGDALVVSAVTQPGSGGTASFTGSSVTFMPAAGFTGTATFSYTASDGRGGTASANVSVTVQASATFSPMGGYETLVRNAAGEPVGSVKATVTGTGAITGTLRYGASYPFSGVLATGSIFTAMIARASLTTLVLTLAFDAAPDGLGARIDGTLADGAATHALVSDGAFYNGAAAPAAGKYTALLAPPADTALPQGWGWATVVVENTGTIAVTGKTADGQAFTSATTIRGDASFQLFATPYLNSTGALGGRIDFTLQPASDGSGTLYWKKPALPGAYAAGFATSTQFTLSRFTAPATGVRTLVFTDLANARGDATLAGGNLTASLARILAISPADLVTVQNPGIDGLAIAINRKNGVTSGAFKDATGQTRNLSGVTFQKTNRAAGFHLDATLSGTFELIPR